MSKKKIKSEAVYLPSNEPYLGRESVYHFDKIIISCMETNNIVARYTHHLELSDLQNAACQIIPQGINIALSIRELVRQAYLFSALVLVRPLIERAALVSYLYNNTDIIDIWKRGWQFRERPSLSLMIETMSDKLDLKAAKELCLFFGHIVHGDPFSSEHNIINLTDGRLGYSVGKVTTDPELCDFICFNSLCYLIVLIGMMKACFPNAQFNSLKDGSLH